MSKYRAPSSLTENVIGLQMVLKGIGALVGAAALVVLGVLGVARLTVPDEPTFAEDFEEAAETPEDFVPSAIG